MKKNWLTILVCCLTWLPFNAYASPALIKAANPNLPAKARGVPMGGALRVHSLDLEEAGNATLELERFSVFAPNATIKTADGKSEPIPDTVYFRGYLTNDPSSVVMLKVPKNGNAVGIVNSKGKAWMLESGSNGLKNRKVDLEKELAGYEFKCGSDGSNLLSAQKMASSMNLAAEAGKAAAATATNVQYAAQIIIDTDYAFTSQFSGNSKAKDYIADLIAYASIPYQNEVKTRLLIKDIRLTTNGNDPYRNKTDCQSLREKLKQEWSNKSTSRALVHLISGKQIGTSCAYPDPEWNALCSKTTGYSVSTGIGSSFDIDHPKPMWEGIVIAHEIGHNFGSRHTHAYCNVSGIADPVDICNHDDDAVCPMPSEYQLPGIGSLSGGTPGEGNGTLMSYCDYKLDGGSANISHTFGLNHHYGVAASRVPNVMLGKVIQHASCMALSLPDFVTEKIKMFDQSGAERYTYKINETAIVRAWIDNTGDADWEEGNTKDKIKVSFFLSKGENVDDDSEWVLVSQQTIQKANLKVSSNAKQEEFSFDLSQLANTGHISAGKYNLVACADYPNTQNNGSGDVQEKSEDNNCSKEAVFMVEPLVKPDLTAHSLQLNGGGTTLPGGTLYGLSVNVQNIDQGSADSSFQIRYEINGPETGGVSKLIADSTFNAVPLASGADQQHKTNDSFAQAPTTEGNYMLRACVDSTAAIAESNEGNNCTETSIYVSAAPVSSLKPVYRFWSDAYQSHFYTITEDEKINVDDHWKYEGIAYCAYPSQEDDALPVYRFWSDAYQNHFYTISEDEKNYVIANYPINVWEYEGIAWYAYSYQKAGTLPVYRFWSDTYLSHFYTISEEEKNYVMTNYPQEVWKFEGVAWHSYQCP